jgi:hypothetical protein
MEYLKQGIIDELIQHLEKVKGRFLEKTRSRLTSRILTTVTNQ